MSKYVLGSRSLQRLDGVHPDLVRVIKRAIKLTPVDFAVIEGLRTKKRQAELVAAGASKTMNSRHLTGHAVDIAPYVAGSIRWDWPAVLIVASAVRQASVACDVDVKWGGSWSLLKSLPTVITAKNLSRSFPDGPHFEVDPGQYPI